MLSMKPLTQNDISKTVHYYADSVDDYYKNEGESSGWFGQGAAYLNLKGEIETDMMKNILLGQIPAGANLQRQEIPTRKFTRADQKHRMGLDLTFSAPKSVSLQTLIGGDAKLIGCHDRAVEAALLAAERYAQARHNVKGLSQTLTTGNLIIARFRHETSRARDPQIHTHCIVMNLTRRPDGEWRTLKNDGIVKRVLFLGQVYRDALAQELVKQGYKLRYDKEGLFELDPFTDAQIEAFSIRSQQIEAHLHEKGLTRETATSSHKQLANLQSRERKMSVNREELFKEWTQRAKELDIEFSPKVGYLKPSLELQAIEPSRRTVSERPSEDQESTRREPTFGLKDAMSNLKFAIDHLTERQAVISEKDLLNVALKHGRGGSRSGDIQGALHHFVKNGELIEVEAVQNNPTKSPREDRIPSGKWYTTPRAIADEQLILSLEAEGRGTVKPIMEAGEAQRLLKDSPLTLEQRNAANMILTTQNRIVGIQGFAGVGKSHLLKTCSQLILKQG
jgi:conjugative relaxase-like TrwC/TraI family protein